MEGRITMENGTRDLIINNAKTSNLRNLTTAAFIFVVLIYLVNVSVTL
jgi:hypothetical protein